MLAQVIDRENCLPGCYAVKVRSRMEGTIGGALQQKGFDVLLPTYVDRRRYTDRVKAVTRALFPGYVFVRTDMKELLPLVSTDGVSYIVKSGNAPHPLPQQEVTAIESLCRIDAPCSPCDNFNVGQKVSIESGPLRGLQGILARIGNKERLVISINSIFSSVSVDLRDTVVTPICE
jgi:transcription antitermination factor NusG